MGRECGIRRARTYAPAPGGRCQAGPHDDGRLRCGEPSGGHTARFATGFLGVFSGGGGGRMSRAWRADRGALRKTVRAVVARPGLPRRANRRFMVSPKR